MKRPPGARDPRTDEARHLDALYGLEPVFEPGGAQRPTEAVAGARGGTEFHAIQCPYCGESFDTLVDCSGGSATYVEDCQVCCQPIELRIEVDHHGALVRLAAVRGD